MRAVLVASVFFAAQALAQTPAVGPAPTPTATPDAGSGVPVALQVQRLAPQLVGFAGSQANFESLVNGLAGGIPVTLTTAGLEGVTQTVTFTPPAGALATPVDIARTLETARQQLISTGVAAPSAQQIATVITGTNVPATVGVTPPVIPGVTPPTAGVAGGDAAAGGTIPSPAQQIQSRTTPIAPRINTSDSRLPGATSASPTPATPGPGVGSTVAPAQSPALTSGARDGATPRR
jgi:hypothetical protein